MRTTQAGKGGAENVQKPSTKRFDFERGLWWRKTGQGVFASQRVYNVLDTRCAGEPMPKAFTLTD